MSFSLESFANHATKFARYQNSHFVAPHEGFGSVSAVKVSGFDFRFRFTQFLSVC